MRYWIYKALEAVILHQTYSNLYLRVHLQELKAKDQALATRIFYGTLQNYRYCSYVWKQYARKKVNQKVQIILSMSTYQLLFLDKVPKYAIINEAVNITKQVAYSYSGFVNAVLHKIDQKKIILPNDQLQRAALLYSCPDWLLKMWQAQYGYEQAVKNARATVDILPIYVRRNPLLISQTTFESNPKIEKTALGVYIYKGNSVTKDPWYQQGRMSIQDAGSYQISAWMDCQPNDTVLDCCAAPGTKTFAMAEMMKDQGRIDSLDIHSHRVQLIQNDCQRLHVHSVFPKVQDALVLQAFGQYDKVLCDVPCSGYGVLARKPDIKMHMHSSDMDTLIPLQQALLKSVSQHVKKGGDLLYSTCTLNKKENEKQVQQFLNENPSFHLIKMQTLFPTNKTDGFFMALMKFK